MERKLSRRVKRLAFHKKHIFMGLVQVAYFAYKNMTLHTASNQTFGQTWQERAHNDFIKSKWPSAEVLSNIINDGILFVAIGANQSEFHDLEWRISFSLAEKKTYSRHESHSVFYVTGF